MVGLRNGRGLVAEAIIAAITKSKRGDWEVQVTVGRSAVAERAKPSIHVFTSPPKGEHLETMIDGLSQVGVTSWTPLRTQRTIVDPRPGKIERLARVCEESLKQCGRAWLLEIGATTDFAIVLAQESNKGIVIVADQSGTPWIDCGINASTVSFTHSLEVLVGPEGGWSEAELAMARDAKAVIASFGPHAMRIETASVVAAASVAMGTR